MQGIKIWMVFIFLSPLVAFGQGSGVDFVRNADWTAIKEKARAENKYIFVDCFTTWCAPCHMMDDMVFPDSALGAFFSANFVSLKAQMDRTKKDVAAIKEQYPTVDSIKRIGNVINYPTFLFFSPDGELVHRVVGASFNPQDFLLVAQGALNPSSQYFKLKKRLEQRISPELPLLKNASLAFFNNSDTENNDKFKGQQYANAYLSKSNIRDLLTQENIAYIKKFTSSSKDAGFGIFVNHQKEIDSVLGAGAARNFIELTIIKEDLFNSIFVEEHPDWALLNSKMKAKHPAFAAAVMTKAHLFYDKKHGKSDAYITELLRALKSGVLKPSNQEYAAFAEDVLQLSNDPAVLNQASGWAERALKDEPDNVNFLTVYGQLLFKTGQKQLAITKIKKAMALSKDPKDEKSYLESVLSKMEKNKIN